MISCYRIAYIISSSSTLSPTSSLHAVASVAAAGSFTMTSMPLIRLDISRQKLLLDPNEPLPQFYPPPRAIMVTPIYDDKYASSSTPRSYDSDSRYHGSSGESERQSFVYVQPRSRPPSATHPQPPPAEHIHQHKPSPLSPSYISYPPSMPPIPSPSLPRTNVYTPTQSYTPSHTPIPIHPSYSASFSRSPGYRGEYDSYKRSHASSSSDEPVDSQSSSAEHPSGDYTDSEYSSSSSSFPRKPHPRGVYTDSAYSSPSEPDAPLPIPERRHDAERRHRSPSYDRDHSRRRSRSRRSYEDDPYGSYGDGDEYGYTDEERYREMDGYGRASRSRYRYSDYPQQPRHQSQGYPPKPHSIDYAYEPSVREHYSQPHSHTHSHRSRSHTGHHEHARPPTEPPGSGGIEPFFPHGLPSPARATHSTYGSPSPVARPSSTLQVPTQGRPQSQALSYVGSAHGSQAHHEHQPSTLQVPTAGRPQSQAVSHAGSTHGSQAHLNHHQAQGRPTSQTVSYAGSAQPGSHPYEVPGKPSSAAKGVLTYLRAMGVPQDTLDEAVKRYFDLLPPAPDFCLSKCTGGKKAVCIGINYIGQRKELRGCANDARNMRDFLMKHHGFPSEQILLLTDDDRTNPLPTRKEMFNAIRWLIDGAKTDDSLFFHYSGHGGQQPDESGREADGMDEVIFPVDFEQAGDIIDDDLHQALVAPLAAGCRLTAIFDACHSGTVLDLPYLHSAHGRLRSIAHISMRARKRGVAPHADVVCFAACKDDETSADTFHEDVAVGAMSWAFIQSLNRNPRQTYGDLLADLRHTLVPRYNQKAQISGTCPVDLTREFTI
ncbi:unnamed protein product [Cyclocybe aegerita]|uniref:Peptidase C14 caspase domain-containing protein n=1 Tax=Cyclocybe aegerita TaxID=1973307 RepID=A0A8S0WMN5_CYCAE|nr:unnamed protein product [Cyclocybe aegerita]